MATAPAARKSEWSPHMWLGCDFFAWLRLLIRNRFAVHWSLWYVALIVTVVSVVHTVLRWLQEVIYGRRIRQTVIEDPPIFIVGHWRSGTTLLHELLVQDERFGYPTMYECLSPNHFLLTEGWLSRWLWFMAPAHRPMDNMKMGMDRPQEDEFALCMMGLPSPYLTIAFPNHPPQDMAYLDLEGISSGALRGWTRGFERFIKQVTLKWGKRLVLKSPPHSARIKVLRALFPGALFVHIVRDPYVVFPSTVHLWKKLYDNQGLQIPTYAGLEEHVYATYLRLYARLEEGKRGLDSSRFFELRYEDLTRDPVGEMRRLYDHLQLGGFERFQPRLEAYLATIKDYETNRYQTTAEQRAEITRRWGDVIRRYGYGERD